jgi:hypothetical protein
MICAWLIEKTERFQGLVTANIAEIQQAQFGIISSTQKVLEDFIGTMRVSRPVESSRMGSIESLGIGSRNIKILAGKSGPRCIQERLICR